MIWLVTQDRDVAGRLRRLGKGLGRKVGVLPNLTHLRAAGPGPALVDWEAAGAEPEAALKALRVSGRVFVVLAPVGAFYEDSATQLVASGAADVIPLEASDEELAVRLKAVLQSFRRSTT